MANAVFSWINHVDTAHLEAVTSGTTTTLPLSNMQTPIIAYFWRGVGGSGSVTVDFGVPRAIDLLAFAQPTDGPLMAATATITHTLDTVESAVGTGAVYHSGARPSGVQPNRGVHAHILPGTRTARYWRMSYNTDLGAVDIGRLWAGPAWKPGINFAYGASRQWLDATPLSVGERSFVPYATRAAMARSYVLPWQSMLRADSAKAEDFMAAVGVSGQFFLHVNPSDPRHALFARLKEIPSVVTRYFDADELTIQAIEHR